MDLARTIPERARAGCTSEGPRSHHCLDLGRTILERARAGCTWERHRSHHCLDMGRTILERARTKCTLWDARCLDLGRTILEWARGEGPRQHPHDGSRCPPQGAVFGANMWPTLEPYGDTLMGNQTTPCCQITYPHGTKWPMGPFLDMQHHTNNGLDTAHGTASQIRYLFASPWS